MTISSAALAAIFAATVGGLVSLLSLIISKEKTISQFRQAWIDALRSEFAAALSLVGEDVWQLQLGHRDPGEPTFEDHYIRLLHEKFFLVRLRLNPQDNYATPILGLLDEIERSIVEGEHSDPDDFMQNTLYLGSGPIDRLAPA